MKFLDNIESMMIKGKKLDICSNIIYPIVKITIQKDVKGNITFLGVNPIAIVVEDDSNHNIIPLIDENIDFERILLKIE